MNKAQVLNLDQSDHNRPVQTRIKIKIDGKYHHEPIISRLISHHGLQVNIVAALLGAKTQDDGWFDLEISGRAQQIDDALIELSNLDVEVWHQSKTEIDGW